jgi:hypothetical protein
VETPSASIIVYGKNHGHKMTYYFLCNAHHIMAANGKNIVGITRDRKETNSVALVRLDIYYGQWRTRASRIATEAINKSGVGDGD